MLSVIMTCVLGTKQPVRFPVSLSSVLFRFAIYRHVRYYALALRFEVRFRFDTLLVDKCEMYAAT